MRSLKYDDNDEEANKKGWIYEKGDEPNKALLCFEVRNKSNWSLGATGRAAVVSAKAMIPTTNAAADTQRIFDISTNETFTRVSVQMFRLRWTQWHNILSSDCFTLFHNTLSSTYSNVTAFGERIRV